jgi:hypothetical protein
LPKILLPLGITRIARANQREQTQEYQNLCAKSDAGKITEAERERLLLLIEQRDYQNAERLTIVAELAKLHGVTLREMMAQLGIRP